VDQPLLWTCPGDEGAYPWQGYIVEFLRVPNLSGDFFNWEPATDFQLLAGSRTDDPGYYGTFAPGVSTYQWSLHAEACPHALSGGGGNVCQ
jgi:hypothetical protein